MMIRGQGTEDRAQRTGHRGQFLLFSVLCSLATCVAGEEPTVTNVILISIDTLGARHLGLYGSSRKTSPNLDAWAKAGATVFERAIAAAPWTLPSHSALFTSRDPHLLKTEIPTDRLSDDETTLAEVLKGQGYRTVAFTGGAFVKPKWGVTQGFEVIKDEVNPDNAEEVFQSAGTWLKEKGAEGKFFLFLHTFEVHDPHVARPPHTTTFDPGYSGSLTTVDIHHIARHQMKQLTLSADDLHHMTALYDSSIAYTDERLARLFKTLEETGLDDTTMMVILSDHGEEFGEHGTWGFHGYSVYEELVHVPLIVKVPGVPSRRMKEPVSLIDVAPTVLDVLGFSSVTPKPFNGKSLKPCMQEGRAPAQPFVFSETSLERDALFAMIESAYKKGISETKVRQVPLKNDTRFVMASSVDWKLLRRPNGSLELYHLGKDPLETVNLAGKGLPEEALLLKALRDRFDE